MASPTPSPLAVLRNEALRSWVGRVVLLAGRLSTLQIQRRLARFSEEQARLREALGVTAATPIRTWGPDVQAEVDQAARRAVQVEYASTSGSTATPKRLAFTRARLRRIRRGSFEVAARLLAQHPDWRPVMFLFAGTRHDGSLTSLLLSPKSRWPGLGEGVITPSAYLHAPALAECLDTFGDTAVRLWLLALCNPGLLYSTNPSTLSVFLHRLEEEWEPSVSLVRAHLRAPHTLPSSLGKVAARTAAPGFLSRFETLARARTLPPLETFLPALRAYCSWDGGYVRPYLTQLERYLPSARYEFIPMYSMSTELVETLTVFDNKVPRFLPLAPGTLYEFLPENAPDAPAHLLGATELKKGGRYTMVASHDGGLRRYQTEDVFVCEGHVAKVPDLRFVQRRGLTWSFTGEKLTDQHVQVALEALRARFPALGAVHLSLLPSQPTRPETLPAYRLVLAPPTAQSALPPSEVLEGCPSAFDEALGAANSEYRSKRVSGRLGPLELRIVPYPALAKALLGAGARQVEGGWESQFKLLPLHRKLWEDVWPELRDCEVNVQP